MENELGTTLRPSEFINKHENTLLNLPEAIPLNEEEKVRLQEFESTLFDKLKTAKKGVVWDHTIYPEYFLTTEGKRMLTLLYKNPNLKQQIEEAAKTSGISPDSEDEEETSEKSALSKFTKEYFEKLKETSRDETSFENATKEMDLEEQSPQSVKDVLKIFYSTDLSAIPKEIRKLVNEETGDWAQKNFREQFWENKGDLSKINNPLRVSRIVDPDKLVSKITNLRELKKDLKTQKASLDQTSDYDKAREVLLSLYQTYINTTIAGLYADTRVIAHEYGYKHAQKFKNDIPMYGMSHERAVASRTMEKIDHFKSGVEADISELDNLFNTIPTNLREFSHKRVTSKETSDIYDKYNQIKTTPEDALALATYVLKSYGFDNWEAVIKKRTGMSIDYDSKDKTGVVKIPEKLSTGLIQTLCTLSHEIEGHVLRYHNREKQKGQSFKIIEEITSGRSGLLSEGASVKVEDETKREIAGIARNSESYYYHILRLKEQGSDFKECLKRFYEMRFDATFPEAGGFFDDREKFDSVFDYVYARTQRIFRKHTPLNDTSGFITTSDQLEYIEQDLVVEMLTSDASVHAGLDKLLYITGLDLYSLPQLSKLGVLNNLNVDKPKMLIARDLWPKLKVSLDNGKSLKEAIEQLTHSV